MDQQVNEIVLQTLERFNEPIERRDLQIECGALENEEFGNALSYLEKRGKIVVHRKKVGLPHTMGCAAATVVRCAKGFLFASPDAQKHYCR